MTWAFWTRSTEYDSTWDELDPVFEESLVRTLNDWPEEDETGHVPVDVYEDHSCLTVYASLPGVRAEQIHVYTIGSILKIEGNFEERGRAAAAQTFFRERYTGRFNRSVPLPADIDLTNLVFTLQDGILKVSIPRQVNAEV